MLKLSDCYPSNYHMLSFFLAYPTVLVVMLSFSSGVKTDRALSELIPSV